MRVSKDTKRRINEIKSDANAQKSALINYLARLEEHAGTKRICKGLERVIWQLETWQRS